MVRRRKQGTPQRVSREDQNCTDDCYVESNTDSNINLEEENFAFNTDTSEYNTESARRKRRAGAESLEAEKKNPNTSQEPTVMNSRDNFLGITRHDSSSFASNLLEASERELGNTEGSQQIARHQPHPVMATVSHDRSYSGNNAATSEKRQSENESFFATSVDSRNLAATQQMFRDILQSENPFNPLKDKTLSASRLNRPDRFNTFSDPALYSMYASMRHQKPTNEATSNNWTDIQRSDNNCLSKSKAERYKWCVKETASTNQKSSITNPITTTSSQINNPRKPFNVTGTGATPPVQEKLKNAMLTGASAYNCRDCGQQFNTKVELMIHVEMCGHFRGMRADKKYNLQEHSSSGPTNSKKNQSVENNMQPENDVSCMECGVLFDSFQALTKHTIQTGHHRDASRSWSQTIDGRSSNNARKKCAPPNTEAYSTKPDVASAVPVAPPSSSPIYHPSTMEALNMMNAQAAPYSKWMNYMMLCAAYNRAGMSSAFGNPSAMLQRSFVPPQVPPTVTSDRSGFHPIKCTQCGKMFDSPYMHIEHLKQSHICMQGAYAMRLPQEKTQVVDPREDTRPHSSNSMNQDSFSGQNNSSSVSRNSPVSNPEYKSSCVHTSTPCDTDRATKRDFINSLQDTIENTMSRVEVSTWSNPAPSLSDERRKFNPFSSSLNKENISDNNRCFNRGVDSASKHALSSSGRNPILISRDSASVTSTSPCMGSPGISSPASKIKERSKHEVRRRRKDSPLDLSTKKNAVHNTTNNLLGECLPSRFQSSVRALSRHNTNVFSNQLSVERPRPSSHATEELSARRETQPASDELRGCKDARQSLFAYMRPKIEAAIANFPALNSTNILRNSPFVISYNKSFSDTYCPLESSDDSDVPSSIHSLKEMQKIVNKTDLGQVYYPINDARKRAGEGGTPSSGAKKVKLSPLNDLLMPKEESPSMDPLRSMQALVDEKLASHLLNNEGLNPFAISSSVISTPELSPHSMTSKCIVSSSSRTPTPSPRSMTSKCASSSCDNGQDTEDNIRCGSGTVAGAASALLSLQSSAFAKHPSPSEAHATDFTSADKREIDVDPHPAASSHEIKQINSADFVIEANFARLLGNTSSPRQLIATSLNQSEVTLMKLMESTGRSREAIEMWLQRHDDEWKSRGQLPFLRVQDEEIELICQQCSTIFNRCEDFQDHIDHHHTEYSKNCRPTSNGGDASHSDPDVTNDEVLEKFPNNPICEAAPLKYQAAMRFGMTSCHMPTSSSLSNGHCSVLNQVTDTSSSSQNVNSVKRARHHPDDVMKTLH